MKIKMLIGIGAVALTATGAFSIMLTALGILPDVQFFGIAAVVTGAENRGVRYK